MCMYPTVPFPNTGPRHVPWPCLTESYYSYSHYYINPVLCMYPIVTFCNAAPRHKRCGLASQRNATSATVRDTLPATARRRRTTATVVMAWVTSPRTVSTPLMSVSVPPQPCQPSSFSLDI